MFKPICERLLLCLSAVLITACGAPAPSTDRTIEPAAIAEPVAPVIERDEVEILLLAAQQSAGEQADESRIKAAQILLERQQTAESDRVLGTVTPPRNRSPLAPGYWQLKARIAMTRQDYDRAESHLARIDVARLSRDQRVVFMELRAELASIRHQGLETARLRLALMSMSANDESLDYRASQLLEALAGIPFLQLQRAEEAEQPEWEMWRSLTLIMRDVRVSPQQQIARITAWREQHQRTLHYPQANALATTYLTKLTPMTRVALLLPLDPRSQSSAEAVLAGFMTGYFEALDRMEQTPEIRVFDTSLAGGIRELEDALRQFAPDLVIGPLLKEGVQQLAPDFLVGTPILALNFDERPLQRSDTVQFGLHPEDELTQLARLARAHPRAIIISSSSPSAQSARIALEKLWPHHTGDVVDSLVFSDISEYRQTLEKSLNIEQSNERRRMLSGITGIPLQSKVRRRQDIDQFILLAEPEAARTIKPLLAYSWSGDIPVAATSMVHSARQEATFDADLDGLRFVDVALYSEQESALRDSITAEQSASGPAERLAALGADAWRLQQRLAIWRWMPTLAFSGATGELTLGDDGRIRRHSSWYTFYNGVPTSLTESPDS